MPGVAEDRIMDMLPFAGLDIEGVDAGTVRVEYNPNRPDFSSDYGIFRALRGIMGIEVGPPKFKLGGKPGFSLAVDSQTKDVRPYIVALVARGGTLDDQTIRQLIAMQEDLHDGIGRRRKKASIGLHDLDSIQFPVRYTTVGPEYSFIPLGETSPKSITEILESPLGKQYGHLLGNSDRYPVIIDRSGSVLSFPPIVNGSVTTVDEETKNLFVEVTGTNDKVAEDILAIIAMTLNDAGFGISSVKIKTGSRIFVTPRMKGNKITASMDFINSTLGLELDAREIAKCLRKSRLGAAVKGSKVICEIPRYRTDISDPVDLAEEVALGYGIYKIEPSLPASFHAGSRDALSRYFDAVRETLVGLGMLESLNFSLVGTEGEYDLLGKPAGDALGVESPKSAEHEVLRESLIPSLLQSLSRNVHEEYPQKLFEIGKVFSGNNTSNMIEERWAVAAVTAHGDASFTEVKSYAQSLLNAAFGKTVETRSEKNLPYFIPGRSAAILVEGREAGTIGEIIPAALEKLRMRVPVSAFEIDLGKILSPLQ